MLFDSSNLSLKLILDKLNKAIFNLRHTGLLSKYLRPPTKSFMYKCYLRPILYYGLDVITLNKYEIDRLRTAENNVIKFILGLHHKNRHTCLLFSLNIMNLDQWLIKSKIKLVQRLLNNDLTKVIINVRLKNINQTSKGKNDLIRGIFLITKDTLPSRFTIKDFENSLSQELSRIECEHLSIKNNDLFKTFKYLLAIHNNIFDLSYDTV